MRWIISASKDVVVDENQLQARRVYIRRVTDARVSAWKLMRVNGPVPREFLYCTSEDEIDGTFITAHIFEVRELCMLREVYGGKLVIANTCIWDKLADKNLLLGMMSLNRDVELFFAKQDLSVESNRILRQTTTLYNIGEFGFHTSSSERKLFTNRGKGLMAAIQMSFDRVSPVILSGELGSGFYGRHS